MPGAVAVCVAGPGARGSWVAPGPCRVLMAALLSQDYVDALLTNYCVSAGRSRVRAALPVLRWLCWGRWAGLLRAPVPVVPLRGSAGRGLGVPARSLHRRLLSAQIWPPVQIANFYFVPLQHR